MCVGRVTHLSHLRWPAILTARSRVAGYGPLDQGAFNQFYEAHVKGHPIPPVRSACMPHLFAWAAIEEPGLICMHSFSRLQDFNSRPNLPFRGGARIVHWQG